MSTKTIFLVGEQKQIRRVSELTFKRKKKVFFKKVIENNNYTNNYCHTVILVEKSNYNVYIYKLLQVHY